MRTMKPSPRIHWTDTTTASTARRPAARADRRFRPTELERFEQRVVPAYLLPGTLGFNPGGYVALSTPVGETSLPKIPGLSGYIPFGQGNGEVCVTFNLTTQGLAAVKGTDGLQVGFDSFILTDPQTNPSIQTVVRTTSAVLTAAHPSVTLCVEVDDLACSQVDAFAGNLTPDQLLGKTPIYSGTGALWGAVIDPSVDPTTNQFVYTVVTEALDDSNYINHLISDDCVPPNIENAGLTIGFWKNHFANWSVYNPTMTLGSVFAGLNTPAYSSLAGVTLGDALSLNGGPSLVDKAALLVKQAVGALLNASSSQVGYPLSITQIKMEVNDALASRDANTILDLQAQLESYNSVDVSSISNPINNKKK